MSGFSFHAWKPARGVERGACPGPQSRPRQAVGSAQVSRLPFVPWGGVGWTAQGKVFRGSDTKATVGGEGGIQLCPGGSPWLAQHPPWPRVRSSREQAHSWTSGTLSCCFMMPTSISTSSIGHGRPGGPGGHVRLGTGTGCRVGAGTKPGNQTVLGAHGASRVHPRDVIGQRVLSPCHASAVGISFQWRHEGEPPVCALVLQTREGREAKALALSPACLAPGPSAVAAPREDICRAPTLLRAGPVLGTGRGGEAGAGSRGPSPSAAPSPRLLRLSACVLEVRMTRTNVLAPGKPNHAHPSPSEAPRQVWLWGGSQGHPREGAQQPPSLSPGRQTLPPMDSVLATAQPQKGSPGRRGGRERPT